MQDSKTVMMLRLHFRKALIILLYANANFKYTKYEIIHMSLAIKSMICSVKVVQRASALSGHLH